MNRIRQPYTLKVVDHGRSLHQHNDNVDVNVYSTEGAKYVATFFTLENIRELFAKNRSSGECASGMYFWAANMVLVEQLDEKTIKTAIDDLIATGEFEKVFDGPHPID